MNEKRGKIESLNIIGMDRWEDIKYTGREKGKITLLGKQNY